MDRVDVETESQFTFEAGHCVLTLERSAERFSQDYVRGDYQWSAKLTVNSRSRADKSPRFMVEVWDRLGVDSLCGWLRALILESRSIAHLMLLAHPGSRDEVDDLALGLIGSLSALATQVWAALAKEQRATERIRY